MHSNYSTEIQWYGIRACYLDNNIIYQNSKQNTEYFETWFPGYTSCMY